MGWTPLGVYSRGALDVALTLTAHDAAATGIVLTIGQSLSIGARGQPALTTTARGDSRAWMFNGGTCPHIHADPGNLNTQIDDSRLASRVAHVEADFTDGAGDTFGETVGRGFVDTFFAEGVRDESFFTVNGRGATAYSGMAINTEHFSNGILMLERAKALCPGPVFLAAIVVVHGSKDSFDNNVNYAADLKQWCADYRRYARLMLGQTWDPPAFVSQVSNLNYQDASAGSRAVALAQVQACHEDPNLHLIGPRYSFEHFDTVHLAAAGYKSMGGQAGRAHLEYRRDGSEYALQPTAATLAGSTVTITFGGVPTGGLVFDTTLVGAKANMGFEAIGATVSSVTITGTNTVDVVCSAPPTAIEIGMQQTGNVAGPGLTGAQSGSARTNLRTNEANPRWAAHTVLDSFPWSPPAEDAPPAAPAVSGHTFTALEQAVADLGPSTWLRADASLQPSGNEILDFAKNGQNWENDGATRSAWGNGTPTFSFDGTGTARVVGPEIMPMGSFTIGVVMDYPVQSATSYYPIGSQEIRNNNRWEFWMISGAVRFRAVVNNSTSGGPTGAVIAGGSPFGVVMRYDAGTQQLRVWVNGILRGDSGVGAYTRKNANASMAIGKVNNFVPHTGQISDVIVFHDQSDAIQTAVEAYFAARVA